MLTANLVSQLHTVGGLPEWEIYVGMHLPDFQDCASSREQLVRGLLTRNARHWEAESNCTEFVKGLGFPQAWLLEAKAVWAKARGDEEGEVYTESTFQASTTSLTSSHSQCLAFGSWQSSRQKTSGMTFWVRACCACKKYHPPLIP